MYDYSKMTQQDFDRLLFDRVADMSSLDVLMIPGVYETVAEYLNNDVLDDWRAECETGVY